MTTEVTSPFAVGYRLTSADEMHALPVGTVMHSVTTGHVYTKRAMPDSFECTLLGTGSNLGSRYLGEMCSRLSHGLMMIDSLPEMNPVPDPALPVVGARITTREELLALPDGTILARHESHVTSAATQAERRWRKQGSFLEQRADASEPWASAHAVTSTRLDGFLCVESYPGATAPVAEAVAAPVDEFAVGTRITSRDMFRRVPVGYSMQRNAQTVWTKVDTENFRSAAGVTHVYTWFAIGSVDRYAIVSVPATVEATGSVTELVVGEPIRREQLAGAPVGTSIAMGLDSLLFTKRDTTTWVTESGGTYTESQFSSNMHETGWIVRSLPAPAGAGMVVPEGCPAVGEMVATREQFDLLPVGTVLYDTGRVEAPITLDEERRWLNSTGGVEYHHTRLAVNINRVASYPVAADDAVTAPAVPPHGIIEGRPIRREQMHDAPVGTSVGPRNANERDWYTKREDERWVSGRGTTSHEVSAFPTDMHTNWLAHRLGVEPDVEGLPAGCVNIGRMLRSQEQIDACPTGTVIRPMLGADLVKQEDGRWSDTEGGWVLSILTLNHNTVVAYPGMVVPPVVVPSACASVGQPLATREQVNACPVGTIVRDNHGSGNAIRLREDGRWVGVENDFDYGPSDSALSLGYNVVESYPVPAAPEGCPAVGERITSTPQMRAMPTGTVIHGNRYGQETKREDGRWEHDGGASRASGSFNFSEGSSYTYTVQSYPTGSVTEPVTVTPAVVGQTVTLEQSHDLPLGTEVDQGGQGYVKGGSGRSGWVYTGGGRISRVLSGDLPIRVTGAPPVPDTDTYAPVVPTPGETLTRFKQRFRTIVLAAQQRNGVDRGPVQSALDRLNVPEYDVTPGMVIDPFDAALLRNVPVGATLVQGTDPVNVRNYRVGVMRADRDVITVLGVNDNGYAPYVLRSAPGLACQDWVTATATQDDATGIEAFKVQAYRVGQAAKRDTRWCGEYEAAMQRAGIDDSYGGDRASQTVEMIGGMETLGLPEGSLVRWSNSTDSVILRRTGGGGNAARTVRVGGTVPGAWTDQQVAVLTRGRAQSVDVSVASMEEATGMPMGTVIEVPGGTQYRKIGRDCWAQIGNGYAYPAAQLIAICTGKYIHIP